MLRPLVARWPLLRLLLVVAVLLWIDPRPIQAAGLAWQAATGSPLGTVTATLAVPPDVREAGTPETGSGTQGVPAAPLGETAANVPQQRRVKVNFFINSIS